MLKFKNRGGGMGAVYHHVLYTRQFKSLSFDKRWQVNLLTETC